MSSKKRISSLDEFHDAVLTTLKKAFGEKVQTVEDYRNDDHHIVTPAIFFDITNIAYGESRDDRLPVELDCSLTLILSNEFPNVGRQIRNFAVETIKVIEDANFGLSRTATVPTGIAARPDPSFDPEKPATTSFVVSWVQTIHLARVTTEDKEVVPCQVWIGFDPNIGKGHEKDYEKLCDRCQPTGN